MKPVTPKVTSKQNQSALDAIRREMTPQMPSAEQFAKARGLLHLNPDDIPDASSRLNLPVDKQAVRAIEQGETPSTPTKTTGAREIDYAGTENGIRKFYADLDYPTRLWLFYVLKGVVFIRGEDPVLANPYDSLGILSRLPARHIDRKVDISDAQKEINSNFIKEEPPVDVLRTLVEKAVPGPQE